MSRFVDIDLSQLPAPQLIETISFEAILAEQKAWVLSRWAEVRVTRPDLPEIDTLMLETEPITLILEALSYRETLLRALVNDKARAVLLAYAWGTNLDAIGVMFGVVRATMVDGSPEPDDRLRRRIQLAPEAFSVAGPAGAYIFHALTQSTEIADAWAFSPAEGRVTVVLAGFAGAPVSDAVITAVINRLDRDDVVPLTDQRSVVRAQQVVYDVTANLMVPRGPDPALIKIAAEQAVIKYAASRYRIGAEVYPVGITAALKVGGVDDVVLSTPLAPVVCGDMQIPRLGQLAVTTTVL